MKKFDSAVPANSSDKKMEMAAIPQEVGDNQSSKTPTDGRSSPDKDEAAGPGTFLTDENTVVKEEDNEDNEEDGVPANESALKLELAAVKEAEE